MSRPVVALCTWEDFNYPAHTQGSATYDRKAPVWVGRDESPTACRASLGDRRLTVWLPQGARITSRAVEYYANKPGGPMSGTYWHVFGSHDRMTRTRIRITLTEYPTL